MKTGKVYYHLENHLCKSNTTSVQESIRLVPHYLSHLHNSLILSFTLLGLPGPSEQHYDCAISFGATHHQIPSCIHGHCVIQTGKTIPLTNQLKDE